MRRRSLAIRLVMALAAVGLFLIGYQWGNQWQAGQGLFAGAVPRLDGVLLDPPLPLPDFVLRGADGPVGRAALLEHWTLLAWASPASASGQRGAWRMTEIAYRAAEVAALRGRLRLWLVSGDEQPVLARDLERLTRELSVLTGAPADLADLAAALGLAPGEPMAEPMGDPVGAQGGDHQHQPGELPVLFLIDPRARLLVLFPSALTPEEIVADLERLARWSRRAPAETGA